MLYYIVLKNKTSTGKVVTAHEIGQPARIKIICLIACEHFSSNPPGIRGLIIGTTYQINSKVSSFLGRIRPSKVRVVLFAFARPSSE